MSDNTTLRTSLSLQMTTTRISVEVLVSDIVQTLSVSEGRSLGILVLDVHWLNKYTGEPKKSVTPPAKVSSFSGWNSTSILTLLPSLVIVFVLICSGEFSRS